MNTARGTFDITLTSAEPELAGAATPTECAKAFTCALQGSGAGLMLSCGDPQSGEAGYIAIETVDGALAGRRGRFALHQLGARDAGTETLHYEVVPGSGQCDLAGITGMLRLTIDADGTHHYELDYDL